MANRVLRRAAVIMLPLAALLASCSGPGREVPALLRTVPSRSIQIMHFRHADKALGLLLDSTHVFRSLDLGRLGNAEMVLSFDCTPTLVPLLSLDAGRYRTDTSEAVKSLLAQASQLGLQAAYVTDSASRTTALLFSPSTAAISEALIHIGSGASILDVDDFAEALRLARGREGFIMMRHSAGGRLLPRGFLGGHVPMNVLSRFIIEASKWTVLSFDSCSRQGIAADFSPLGPSRYYLSIFGNLDASGSRIGKILPENTDFAVDLPLGDWEAFYEARCRWMDATSRLKRHEWHCDDLRKEHGISPLDWCRRIRPQELAFFQWEGRSIVAVRCRKAPKLPGTEVCPVVPNPLPGYAGEMFGSLFREPGESFCAVKGKWLLLGSAEDLAAYCLPPVRPAPETGETVPAVKAPESFGKKVKFAIWHPEWNITCTSGGTEINITEQ